MRTQRGKNYTYTFGKFRAEIAGNKSNKYSLSNEAKAFVIEQFYGYGLSLPDLSKFCNVTPQTINKILGYYSTPFNIERVVITKLSKV